MQSGAIFDRFDKGRFLVAFAFNPQKALGRARGTIDLLAELKRQDGIVSTLDHHDGSRDLSQAGNRVELRVNEKAKAWQKPKHFPGGPRRRRKRCLEDEASNFVLGGEVGGYDRSQRLTERHDGLWIETLGIDQKLVRCVSVKIETGLTGLTFAVAIASILQREDVSGQVTQKLIGCFPIGNIGCVSVEC